jgi:transcriptional regulator
MHPNPIYRQASEAEAMQRALERGFGILTVHSGSDILAAHVPFVAAGSGRRLEAHLVRSNPIARALAAGPCPALLIVSGPDAYVSPDWYGMADQVPTWNYLAVHLRGTLHLLDEASLAGHLERLSARFERTLSAKKPWTLDKMSESALGRLMRMIVPVGLQVSHVDSTTKLSQNKSAAARCGVADALEAGGVPGMEIEQIAQLMRALPGA